MSACDTVSYDKGFTIVLPSIENFHVNAMFPVWMIYHSTDEWLLVIYMHTIQLRVTFDIKYIHMQSIL